MLEICCIYLGVRGQLLLCRHRVQRQAGETIEPRSSPSPPPPENHPERALDLHRGAAEQPSSRATEQPSNLNRTRVAHLFSAHIFHSRAVAEYAVASQSGQTPRPLCMVDGDVRKKMGSVAVPTEVDHITISRAPDPLPRSIRLSQVLFLVSELEKWF